MLPLYNVPRPSHQLCIHTLEIQAKKKEKKEVKVNVCVCVCVCAGGGGGGGESSVYTMPPLINRVIVHYKLSLNEFH